MKRVRDTFCSYCGAGYSTTDGYPRTCGACSTTVWANPLPVSVVLVPVRHEGREGLLVIRRGIEPGKGKLALVGGFLEEHETWQAGGVREVKEECGVIVDPASVTPFWFTSTEPRPNRVLLFSIAAPLEAGSFAPYAPDTETLERGAVFGPGGLADVFSFPLHVEAARRFFVERGVDGEHAYVSL